MSVLHVIRMWIKSWGIKYSGEINYPPLHTVFNAKSRGD